MLDSHCQKAFADASHQNPWNVDRFRDWIFTTVVSSTKQSTDGSQHSTSVNQTASSAVKSTPRRRIKKRGSTGKSGSGSTQSSLNLSGLPEPEPEPVHDPERTHVMVYLKEAYITLLTQAYLAINDHVTRSAVREHLRIFPRDRPLNPSGYPSCVMDELLRGLHGLINHPTDPGFDKFVFDAVLPALR